MPRTFHIIRGLLLGLLFCLSQQASARHGKGGSITYAYLGPGVAAGSSAYRVTVKHYVDCNSENLIEAVSYLGIFDAGSNTLVKTVPISRSATQKLEKLSYGPCINPPPVICFYVVDYITDIEIPDNTAGYVLSEQECCRISNIINVQNSSNYGTTNTNTIPGVINGVVYRKNSSPVFAQRDSAIICHNSSFTIDFSAADTNGDMLVYSFCPAKAGASSQDRQPNPPKAPPYADLPYQGIYSASAPMGSDVKIDARTGIISGIAPATTGTYVVSVCVSEYRDGLLIGNTKKEVHITVADCTLSAASLLPAYINCDTYNFSFKNESEPLGIDKYAWDFGVLSSTADTSSKAAPVYTYADTGTYVLKLKVSTAAGCVDSTVSKVIVYPGFNPGFAVTGSCYQSPFQFADLTTALYGVVDSWSWDFGEPGLSSDTSSARNPSYTYASQGTRTVSFIVSTSKGCIDTVTKTAVVNDKPLLTLPFRDTLICSIDTLRLFAVGNGNFSWSPGTFIQNAGTASPLVYPKDTAVYTVTLNELGCVAKDSVKVNVLDFITVKLPADTTICLTDSIRLRPVSYALQYQWSPAGGLSDPLVKSPEAAPGSSTRYQVTANLGKCQDRASILIRTVPYPQAYAGADTAVCFGDRAMLNAAVTGSSFAWSPASTLQNAGTLHPVTFNSFTTRYVLTAYDTLGCPKPWRDTVVVTVRTKVAAFAGNDTVVVAGQPLQLNASGGSFYLWTPPTGLSSVSAGNPVSILSAAIDSLTYTVRVTRDDGCFASDDVKVAVFRTRPDIFVPTGFTPNGDGRNDVLRPILVGMKNLTYFRVYNRWGQLLFSTSTIGQGWDGTLHGVQQVTDTFVFTAEGTDYLGRKLQRKGTVLLIR